MKRVAVIQSNYIPWKGYFDIINMVDEFVLYDDCQYTKRDWRNRNKIKTPQGTCWMTIPVKVKGKYEQRICEVEVADKNWARKHWITLENHYARAKHFPEVAPFLQGAYEECNDESKLSRLNYHFIKVITERLGVKTRLSWSMDYELGEGTPTEKLVSLLMQVGADAYLSGPSARGYLEEKLVKRIGCKIEWMDYSGYPEYGQLFPPFEHGVSIVDLLLNEGVDGAKKYMKSFGGENK